MSVEKKEVKKEDFASFMELKNYTIYYNENATIDIVVKTDYSKPTLVFHNTDHGEENDYDIVFYREEAEVLLTLLPSLIENMKEIENANN